MVREILRLASAILLIATARADETLRTIDLAESVKLAADDRVQFVQGGATAIPTLAIVNSVAAPATFTLARIESPGITRDIYAVTGEVSYENVSGDAYLMTLSEFPDGAYFSKANDSRGPIGRISGNSNWRKFVVPFSTAHGDVARPVVRPARIEWRLVMPGRGTVALRNVRLVQFAPGEDPLGAGQWWSEQNAGLIGGIGGSVIGCLGGLLGTLAGRCRARRFVLFMMTLLTVLGGVAILVGVFALVRSQPYAVWYPLLLGGGICVIAIGVSIPGVRRRYDEFELRKTRAMDALAS